MLTEILEDYYLHFQQIINLASMQQDPSVIMRDNQNLDKIIFFLKVNERLAHTSKYAYLTVL